MVQRILHRVVLTIRAIIYTKNLEQSLAYSKYIWGHFKQYQPTTRRINENFILHLKNIRETKVAIAIWNLRILVLD